MITKLIFIAGAALLLVLTLLALFGLSAFMYGFMKVLVNRKKISQQKQDSVIRAYFAKYDSDNPLAIIDETPRPLEVGEGLKKRTYILRPLKYRQITRLCILFAKVLERLHKENLDLDNADMVIGKIIEICEDDFFRAMAYILYFSRNENETDDQKIALGIEEEFKFIQENINLQQMTRALELVVMQNDIKRALDGFGRLSVNKKKGNR